MLRSVLNFFNYVFLAGWYKYKKDVPVDEEGLQNSGPGRPTESFYTSVNGPSRQQEELLKSTPGCPTESISTSVSGLSRQQEDPISQAKAEEGVREGK